MNVESEKKEVSATSEEVSIQTKKSRRRRGETAQETQKEESNHKSKAQEVVAFTHCYDPRYEKTQVVAVTIDLAADPVALLTRDPVDDVKL